MFPLHSKYMIVTIWWKYESIKVLKINFSFTIINLPDFNFYVVTTLSLAILFKIKELIKQKHKHLTFIVVFFFVKMVFRVS